MLRVGGLGAGYFSQFHYDAWLRNPATELIAVADPVTEKCEAAGATHNYENLDDMLSAQPLDILDIITPPPTHYKSILKACDYKPKAIICQKPFCTSLDEAEMAVQAAKDANVPLIIHENFRFQPWFRCLKEAIKNNALGQTLQFTFRLRTGDGQGSDAYLARQPYFRNMPRFLIRETGVHYVDTCIFLFGPVVRVYAELMTHNPTIKGEDACYVILEHKNGIRSLIDGNRLLDHRSTNTRLTFGEAMLEGTDATLTLEGTGRVQQRAFGSIEQHTLLEPEPWEGFAGDCVYALQNHVVNALKNKTPFENLAEDYLNVLRLVNTIYSSAQQGRKMKL